MEIDSSTTGGGNLVGPPDQYSRRYHHLPPKSKWISKEDFSWQPLQSSGMAEEYNLVLFGMVPSLTRQSRVAICLIRLAPCFVMMMMMIVLVMIWQKRMLQEVS